MAVEAKSLAAAAFCGFESPSEAVVQLHPAEARQHILGSRESVRFPTSRRNLSRPACPGWDDRGNSFPKRCRSSEIPRRCVGDVPRQFRGPTRSCRSVPGRGLPSCSSAPRRRLANSRRRDRNPPDRRAWWARGGAVRRTSGCEAPRPARRPAPTMPRPPAASRTRRSSWPTIAGRPPSDRNRISALAFHIFSLIVVFSSAASLRKSSAVSFFPTRSAIVASCSAKRTISAEISTAVPPLFKSGFRGELSMLAQSVM